MVAQIARRGGRGGLAQDREAARGLAGRLDLRQADALALPFPDGSFDVAASAFGIPSSRPTRSRTGRPGIHPWAACSSSPRF